MTEMHQRRENTWKETSEDNARQKKFWSIFKEKQNCSHDNDCRMLKLNEFNFKMGRNFLKNNPFFLE